MESIHLSSITPLNVFKKIKGIIFDCDGVLIDSIDSNIWYYNEFKKKFGLKPLSKDEIIYVHAHTVFESIRHIIPEQFHEEAFAMRQDPALAGASNYIKLTEGIFPFLEWCKANHLHMAVNTNRTDSLHAVLKKFNVDNFFFPTVTATLLPNCKPHPEGVYYILGQWRLKASDVVYIGDTWIDEACAQAAGVEFWAYRNTGLNARLHISDYWLLQRALSKLVRNGWT